MILFEHCHANNLLPKDITSTQISTKLRVSNFPVGLQSLQISKVSDLTKFLDYAGLVRLLGVVTGVSGLAKYTQSTKYICSQEDCEGQSGNKYIRTHVPGASEKQTIRSDFQCKFCGDTLEEVKASRTLSDRVVAEILPIRLVGPGQKEVFDMGRVQSIPVFIRDDLVSKVDLGKTFEVIGICRKDHEGESIAIAMEANNVTELERSQKSSIDLLPVSIRKAYNGTKSSPWRFPFYMAYRFGEQVLSRGAMLKLKLVLLVSLTLDPQKHSLHILALSRETSMVTSLMDFSKQFSRRTFPASLSTPLSANIRKDGSPWPPHFIQAGSLTLASGGVCPLGDLSLWQKPRRDQLHTILNSHKMFVELPTQGGLPQQEVVPLNCHVWATYDPSSCPPSKQSKNDLLLPAAETGQIGKTLLDSFSYVSFLESGDQAMIEAIVTLSAIHTLVSWSQVGKDEETDIFQQEDLNKFVELARGTATEMTVEAETLLYSYYMAGRTARSSGLNGSDVPNSALTALTSLAVGVAKLKLSPVVSEEDAVLAIYLYEESLTSRFGLSVLSVPPQPHIPETQIPMFLGKELDLHFQQFRSRLHRFCSDVMQYHFKPEP